MTEEMRENTLDNEDWHLAIHAEWVPKKAPYSITCPGCRGRGEVGGGFKDIDGPRTCSQCFGSRVVTHPGPDTPQPQVPEELVRHMRAAYKDFLDNGERKQEEEPPTPLYFIGQHKVMLVWNEDAGMLTALMPGMYQPVYQPYTPGSAPSRCTAVVGAVVKLRELVATREQS